MRLQWFTKTMKARTTALVSSASVLFADRLMNLDIAFGDDVYLGLIMQRIRRIFAAQVPKKMDEVKEREKVMVNHRKILQILIRGDENDEDEDDDDAKEKEMNFETAVSTKNRWMTK